MQISDAVTVDKRQHGYEPVQNEYILGENNPVHDMTNLQVSLSLSFAEKGNFSRSVMQRSLSLSLYYYQRTC